MSSGALWRQPGTWQRRKSSTEKMCLQFTRKEKLSVSDSFEPLNNKRAGGAERGPNEGWLKKNLIWVSFNDSVTLVICRSQSFIYGGWSPFKVWIREFPVALPVKGTTRSFPMKANMTRMVQESAQHLSASRQSVSERPFRATGLVCCFSGPVSALLFNSCLVKYFVKICGQNNWFSFVAQRAVCVGLLLLRLHSFPSLHGVLKKVFEKVHTPLRFFLPAFF